MMQRLSLFGFAIVLVGVACSTSSSSNSGPDASATDSSVSGGTDSGGGGNDSSAPPDDAGGGSDTSTPTDAGTKESGGPTVCALPDGGGVSAGSQLCSGKTCVILMHQVDCCGTKVALSVTSDVLTAYQAQENALEANCPSCNCPPQPTKAQDGKTAQDAAAIQVDCVPDPGYPDHCQTFIP